MPHRLQLRRFLMLTAGLLLAGGLCAAPCLALPDGVVRGDCLLPGVEDAVILEEANAVLRATQGLDAVAEVDWVVLDCQQGTVDVLVRGPAGHASARRAVGRARVPLSEPQAWPAVQMGLRTAAAAYARHVQGLDGPVLAGHGAELGYGVTAWLGGLNNVGANLDFVADLARTKARLGVGMGTGFSGWTADVALQAVVRGSRQHYGFLQAALSQLMWWEGRKTVFGYFSRNTDPTLGPYRFLSVGAGYGGQVSARAAIEVGAQMNFGRTEIPGGSVSSTLFAISVALTWSSVAAVDPSEP